MCTSGTVHACETHPPVLRRPPSAVAPGAVCPVGCGVAWVVQILCASTEERTARTFLVLKGHKNAVLELHWMPEGDQMISASPDQTVRAWDVATGKQVGRSSAARAGRACGVRSGRG